MKLYTKEQYPNYHFLSKAPARTIMFTKLS